MPLYEYFCTRCASKYELLRPIDRGDEPATCPQGHGGGSRVLSLFATVSKGEGGSDADFGAMPSSGGCACGGGGCGCGH